jgi:hypothetical protein
MTMRKATPQEEKDFREVVTVVIVAITLILLLVYVYPSVYTYVFGQVEVKQSTTLNGQTTSMKTQDDKTTIKVLQGGTIQLTNDPKDFKIKYCDSGCQSYRLLKNGTMIEEN